MNLVVIKYFTDAVGETMALSTSAYHCNSQYTRGYSVQQGSKTTKGDLVNPIKQLQPKVARQRSN